MTDRARWICCQLGAREHYAAPRALHARGDLALLVTDAWANGWPWSAIPGKHGQRLRERHSPDLATATVEASTPSLLAHEVLWRLRGLRTWPLVLARNRWFQSLAAQRVSKAAVDARLHVVFAHSYAALEILRAAKARGFMTVLGQIDPGEAHVQTLRDVARRWPEFGPPLEEPPPEYFTGWREECRLADRIVVNSEWSRDLLGRARIDAGKIHVVPLPHDAEAGADRGRRYPAAFTAGRPLRVLFVGSVAAFKGVPSLLESLALVGDQPIELRIVGPIAATIPSRFLSDPRIRWVGAVPRSEVMTHYLESDVLAFPSHSDGFGMAQVEAQAHRLPIIASRSCGRVVQDGVNGWLLPDVSAAAIAAALKRAGDPALLAQLAAQSPAKGSTLGAFGEQLAQLVHGA